MLLPELPPHHHRAILGAAPIEWNSTHLPKHSPFAEKQREAETHGPGTPPIPLRKTPTSSVKCCGLLKYWPLWSWRSTKLRSMGSPTRARYSAISASFGSENTLVRLISSSGYRDKNSSFTSLSLLRRRCSTMVASFRQSVFPLVVIGPQPSGGPDSGRGARVTSRTAGAGAGGAGGDALAGAAEGAGATGVSSGIIFDALLLRLFMFFTRFPRPALPGGRSRVATAAFGGGLGARGVGFVGGAGTGGSGAPVAGREGALGVVGIFAEACRTTSRFSFTISFRLLPPALSSADDEPPEALPEPPLPPGPTPDSAPRPPRLPPFAPPPLTLLPPARSLPLAPPPLLLLLPPPLEPPADFPPDSPGLDLLLVALTFFGRGSITSPASISDVATEALSSSSSSSAAARSPAPLANINLEFLSVEFLPAEWPAAEDDETLPECTGRKGLVERDGPDDSQATAEPDPDAPADPLPALEEILPCFDLGDFAGPARARDGGVARFFALG